MSWMPEPSSSVVAKTELASICPVKVLSEGLSVRLVTALSCSVTGSAVVFSVLNNEETVGR